VSELDSGTGF